MFSELRHELQNKKVYLYLGATIACLVSVFGVILLMAATTEDLSAALPSPSPNTFGQILGEQSKLQPGQRPIQQEETSVVGPERPIVSPSPLKSSSPNPSPSMTPSPIPSVVPSPSPSPSPSPTPSPSPSTNTPQNTDTSGPLITEIQETGIESNKVIIHWKTNEDADERVKYGKEIPYLLNKDSVDKKTTHLMEISGLEKSTLYHYQIISKDTAGNATTSEDRTFTTSQ